MAADLGLVDAEADLVGLLLVLVLLVRPPLPPLVGVVVEVAGGAVVELELELELEEPAAFWYWLTTKSTMSLP